VLFLNKYVKLVDTTLRDGEQTKGVSFSLQEKLMLSKMLLKEVGVDFIEVASARVSEGEKKAVSEICNWANKEDMLDKVEVLGFVDNGKSVNWIKEAGCNTMNLLTKGSLKHCKGQLGKSAEEHYADVENEIKGAHAKGVKVNVYLEDWSNGIRESKEYVFGFVKRLKNCSINRLMLPDTLGILDPLQVRKYLREMKELFPVERMDFHAHNDYGLAVSNSLIAVQEGIRTLHCTVNGLGERTGNASLAEVAVAVNDKTKLKCNVQEKNLLRVSKIVENISGKKVSANQPIVGKDVFTQTAGIHADGDIKGNLYANPLTPNRFGRRREYALGKLSGKASLEQNLKEMDIELNAEQKKAVLERVVKLGDKKEKITAADLPFIIGDVLNTPIEKKVKIDDYSIITRSNQNPLASFTFEFENKKIRKSAEGDGGYDAFMNALSQAANEINLVLPELVDYEVRIPPGGKPDAIVETTITWKQNGKEFSTIGVDSDQVAAAIKATEKMLNLIISK